MTKRLSRPMRLSELARMLGIDGARAGRRAMRQLQGIERVKGVTLMTRSGSGRGTRYIVHLSVLREHHPDLFYRRDEAQEALREWVEEYDEKLVRATDRTDTLARIVSEKIRKLELRVASLEASH